MGELWMWFDQIHKAPSYVKTLADFELELLEIEVQKKIFQSRLEIEEVEAVNPGHKLSSPHLEKYEAVLGRVLGELERRKEAAAPQPEIAADLRPLLPYFHDGQNLDLALNAATETGLIDDAGKWVHVGFKTHAVSIFWRACVVASLAKSDAPVYKVRIAMKEQFCMDSLGPNAIDQKKEIADFGEDYKELYKELLKKIRP